MKTFRLTLILTLLLTAPAAFAGVDVNGDNSVDVSDLNYVINSLMGQTTGYDCDVNGDGFVDVADINLVINAILGSTPQPDPEPKRGHDYVWDMTRLPEIHIAVSLNEWNRLLSLYDENPGTKQYIMARRFTFTQNGQTTTIDSIGMRLRGNTSRRRPEGEKGQKHNAQQPQLRHFHIGVNLRKYNKDELHTIDGVRKLNLKWFSNDPTYVRELFSYNTFRDFGVWTASRDNYCRLWIKIDGDPTETYMGVYEMIEPVDENYLKNRADALQFGTAKGNLWKCQYVGAPATLTNPNNGDYYYDDNSDDNHTYTLQTNTKRFDNAKAQFIDFQLKLNGKSRESFYTWIQQVCDVDLLLKTYAVNVALGMWDDYWNNSNNYYLYFTTEDLTNYKVYFIPYDYDNSLGTTSQCGNQSDAGRQDPLQWGLNTNPLIQRLMDYDDFRTIYINYLKQLVDPQTGPIYYKNAAKRIRAWQNKVQPYVDNDTGEDTTISDRPASWGNHGEYRLLDESPDVNYFRVKADVINQLR